MIKKTLSNVEVKEVDSTQGLIEAFTNSMGIVDSDGDVIDPVAFNGSIAKNLPIPVLAGHDSQAIVGKVLSARPVHVDENEYRLYTLMQMNMETQSGREAFSNVKGGFVREWSVGFNVPEEGWEYEGQGKSQTRRIKDLDWVEVSTVIRGASPQTQTISAKSDDAIKVEQPETIAPSTDDKSALDAEKVRVKLEIAKMVLKRYMRKINA
tara:strand:- start:1990 stop:2616 length:627 start_codon:yes stop_codon:yes gene_type:complete